MTFALLICNIVLIFIAYDVVGIGALFFLSLINAVIAIGVFVFGWLREDEGADD